eukprot:scaffold273_cov242-Pinguiococcus_pyrenoidosus.AAC.9
MLGVGPGGLQALRRADVAAAGAAAGPPGERGGADGLGDDEEGVSLRVRRSRGVARYESAMGCSGRGLGAEGWRTDPQGTSSESTT